MTATGKGRQINQIHYWLASAVYLPFESFTTLSSEKFLVRVFAPTEFQKAAVTGDSGFGLVEFVQRDSPEIEVASGLGVQTTDLIQSRECLLELTPQNIGGGRF